MRLGILSDTHDRLARTCRAVEILRAEGAEALIHCGDVTGKEIVFACAVLPCYFVFGNNDADNVSGLRKAMRETESTCLEWGGEVMIASTRIAVVHGHMHTDVRRLLLAKPDYLLSGHSHKAAFCREGFTRRLNPGALHRAREFTVAILDLETKEVRFLTVPS